MVAAYDPEHCPKQSRSFRDSFGVIYASMHPISRMRAHAAPLALDKSADF
jgi:hypothetical protein